MSTQKSINHDQNRNISFLKKVQLMSRFRGGVQGGGRHLPGPFAERKWLSVLRVGRDRLLWSTDVTPSAPLVESSVVSVRFCTSGNVELTSHFSKRSNGLEGVLWICIAASVREMCERRFSGWASLHGVIFGSSSKVERLCRGAFSRTSIESLYIPDSVVEVGEECFSFCKNLHTVRFGASPKVERLCCKAFYGTSIESLYIPDSVVEIGEECFSLLNSLHTVIFGSSSKVERLCCKAFHGTSIESLYITDNVVEIGEE